VSASISNVRLVAEGIERPPTESNQHDENYRGNHSGKKAHCNETQDTI
jgi:hypothetical protein